MRDFLFKNLVLIEVKGAPEISVGNIFPNIFVVSRTKTCIHVRIILRLSDS